MNPLTAYLQKCEDAAVKLEEALELCRWLKENRTAINGYLSTSRPDEDLRLFPQASRLEDAMEEYDAFLLS
jgi:hypothetical protein